MLSCAGVIAFAAGLHREKAALLINPAFSAVPRCLEQWSVVEEDPRAFPL